jgi:hypothetical protein
LRIWKTPLSQKGRRVPKQHTIQEKSTLVLSPPNNKEDLQLLRQKIFKNIPIILRSNRWKY